MHFDLASKDVHPIWSHVKREGAGKKSKKNRIKKPMSEVPTGNEEKLKGRWSDGKNAITGSACHGKIKRNAINKNAT